MRYEDQPLCETCRARYPEAEIRHPPNHARDASRPGWLGIGVLLLAWRNVVIDLWWVAAPLAVVGVLLLALAGSILHHELIDRPRYRASR